MSIILSKQNRKEAAAINYNNLVSKSLLLIFTRNPQLGKCKTRLADKVGDKTALNIYEFLLDHTVSITKNLNVAKQVWYSEEIWENDIWSQQFYDKKLQIGAHLGLRMANAFQEGFSSGFDKIIVIGSDLYDFGQADIEDAFERLEDHDFVIGPAADGGYYLLGMRFFKPDLFHHKAWGSPTVLKDTLKDLKHENHALLAVRNDVDVFEDIKDNAAFKPFLKNQKK